MIRATAVGRAEEAGGTGRRALRARLRLRLRRRRRVLLLDGRAGRRRSSRGALEESGAFAPRRAVEIVARCRRRARDARTPRAWSTAGSSRATSSCPRRAASSRSRCSTSAPPGSPAASTRASSSAIRSTWRRSSSAASPTQRTDVYSLGVMHVRAVLGHAAVQRPDARPGHDAAPGRAAAAAAGRRAELGKIILKALAKAPLGPFSVHSGIAGYAAEAGRGTRARWKMRRRRR